METTLQKRLKICIDHLNRRRLKFDAFNFPLEKTVYKLFNIRSKKWKRKFEEKLKLLKQKKILCDICNNKIDEFYPSLLYEIDVVKWTIRFNKIEACCSKCHMIKTFVLFQNEMYKNMQIESVESLEYLGKMSDFKNMRDVRNVRNVAGLINFSPIYEHYYKVNGLENENELLMQNDINIYFSCAILLKNIKWLYITPHKTVDDFLTYSLKEKGKKNKTKTKWEVEKIREAKNIREIKEEGIKEKERKKEKREKKREEKGEEKKEKDKEKERDNDREEKKIKQKKEKKNVNLTNVDNKGEKKLRENRIIMRKVIKKKSNLREKSLILKR